MFNKIVNFQNYDHAANLPEPSVKPSKTIPGQDMAIKTLVDRYVRGQHVETFIPTYTEDIDPAFFKMDKQDAAMAARHLRKDIEKEQQRKQPAKQADLEELIEEVKKDDKTPPAVDDAPGKASTWNCGHKADWGMW